MERHLPSIILVRLLAVGAIIEGILHVANVGADRVNKRLSSGCEALQSDLTDDAVPLVAPRVGVPNTEWE